MAVPAERPIRFLQVVTFYPAYLRDFYAARPELHSAPYATQVDALLDDGFSGCHNLSRELAKGGWQASTVIANAAPAQRRWLAENDLTLPEPLDGILVAAMQIQMLRPDVVYFTDLVQFGSAFLRKLPNRPPLTILWRGFGIPPGTDLSEHDVIVSSFDRIFTEAPQFGARDVQRHYPGFQDDFDVDEPPIYDRDVIFSGSVTSQHVSRVALLQLIWRASRGDDGGTPFGFELFMPDVSMFPPEMQKINRGSLWGNAMLRALNRSRITINVAVDGFDVQPPNMRVIEATGAGAFLLTNAHPQLVNFFAPGKELETFANGDELIAKIRHYLAHEPERQAIARRGRVRCLTDRSMAISAARFRAMVEQKLNAKA